MYGIRTRCLYSHLNLAIGGFKTLVKAKEYINNKLYKHKFILQILICKYGKTSKFLEKEIKIFNIKNKNDFLFSHEELENYVMKYKDNLQRLKKLESKLFKRYLNISNKYVVQDSIENRVKIYLFSEIHKRLCSVISSIEVNHCSNDTEKGYMNGLAIKVSTD